jgi:lipoyl(octanoyl) transferase
MATPGFLSDQPAQVEWQVSSGLTGYPDALKAMESRVAAIYQGEARELVWSLEHPPLYTAGTSAAEDELLIADRFPVFEAGRGGRYTYHGPGQRIVYVMLNLARRQRDVRHYVHSLESWVINALAYLGLEAWRAPGRIGIWTNDGNEEAKIGAIGVRVRRWVTFHGFAINLAPDLEHFDGIVPCGISEFPVTSLEKLGYKTSMAELDHAIQETCPEFMEMLGMPAKK